MQEHLERIDIWNSVILVVPLDLTGIPRCFYKLYPLVIVNKGSIVVLLTICWIAHIMIKTIGGDVFSEVVRFCSLEVNEVLDATSFWIYFHNEWLLSCWVTQAGGEDAAVFVHGAASDGVNADTLVVEELAPPPVTIKINSVHVGMRWIRRRYILV